MPADTTLTLIVLLAGFLFVVGSILAFRLPPFLALIGGAALVGVLTPEHIRLEASSRLIDLSAEERAELEAEATAAGPVARQIAAAFGDTCGKIGLLIAFAAVIGHGMRYSGAADAIVRATLRLIGQDRGPIALVASGFTIGIPVFFDTVFYLMIPIARSLHERTKGNFLLMVLCIICGATMAHSLIPPTPGPLYIAQKLGVSLGTMAAAGIAVGLLTATTGYIFARIISRNATLVPPEDGPHVPAAAARLEAANPPVWLATLPIVVPLLLLGAGTLLADDLGKLPYDALGWGWLVDKNAAIAIGAILSIALLVRYNQSATPWQQLTADSLMSAGQIVLITGAGGAFGAMMRQAGVRGLFESLPEFGTTGLLMLGFLITTAIRTAQGSSTVAMIITVGLFENVTPAELGCHPVYLAMAIGCGGKPFAWMNDSAFWVMTRMSGMTPGQGLRYITPMTATMAAVGQAAIVAAAHWFPDLPV